MKYCYLNLIILLFKVYQMTGLNATFPIINKVFRQTIYDSGLTEKNYGVPPGSVLAPLLFLLYIFDLNQAIKFHIVHHFADDTNFLYLGKSIKKLNKLVNFILKNLVNWLNGNKILLYVKKN